MSDININFSGLIAVFILFVTIGVFAAAAVFTFAASFYQTRVGDKRLVEQNLFSYFIAAILMLIFNGLAFAISITAIDHISGDAREILDTTMLVGWLPLNLIVFFIIKKSVRRRLINEN